MRSPTLSELPPPPPEKTGWPWTEESPQLEDTMPDGSDWPCISIVTPNYNYGHFLEETLRSILLQGYPNLEYIVIDGGSTDNSIEVIKKYAPWLTYWVSESDKGQANAINKGIGRCSGSIFNWINSDDVLTQGSLRTISKEMQNASALAATVCNFDENSRTLIMNRNLSSVNLILGSQMHQPGLWFRLDKVRSVGLLQESFQYCFDLDLSIRYLAKFSDIQYSSEVVCNFRLHSISKTVTDWHKFGAEHEKSLATLLSDPDFGNLAPFLSVGLRRKKWYGLIEGISTSEQMSRFQKGIEILIGSLIDPKARWTRFTFGAIRKVLVK
jgi:glycosyltransferase involved in cell wall biosynthesis